jgi:hypothetical protein
MTDINVDELRSTLLTYWKELGIKAPPPEQFDDRLLELQLVVLFPQMPVHCCSAEVPPNIIPTPQSV